MKPKINKSRDPFSDSLMQEKMNEFEDAIKSHMARVEPLFLRLGQDMQNCYSDSAQLTRTIANSANITGSNSEGSLINHIDDTVNDLLQELNSCRDTITANSEHMGSSTGELGTLSQTCTGLTRIARFLNIVGMNIDVESCRSTESKNMFQGFGGEVKELAQKIAVIAEQIQMDSKSVQSSQMAGVNDIKTALKELSILSGSAQESVSHAMNNVERLTQLSHTTLNNAAIHSNEIQEQVGGIVMGIQFHDIVRQKLEHVISAFKDCKTLLTHDQSGENLQRVQAKIYFILKVQAAQLSKIRSELNTVHTNLEQAFTMISDKTDRLMSDVVGSGMGKKEEKELAREFDSIEKALERLKKLHTHGQSMSNRMMERIRETSLIISGLSQYTDQVNSINISLQYKALNAIIMTSKLGEKGRTLEVLAREVRLISMNSDELMEQIVKALKSVAEITGNLKELNREGSAEISDTLTVSLDSTMHQISTTLGRYEENRSQSVEIAGKLNKDIKITRKRVHFISQWAEDIGTIETELNEILEQVQPLILSMDKAVLTEYEDIAKRYTMESEREVHLQTALTDKGQMNRDCPGNETENQTIGEISQDNQACQANQDDEFDDNIELF